MTTTSRTRPTWSPLGSNTTRPARRATKTRVGVPERSLMSPSHLAPRALRRRQRSAPPSTPLARRLRHSCHPRTWLLARCAAGNAPRRRRLRLLVACVTHVREVIAVRVLSVVGAPGLRGEPAEQAERSRAMAPNRTFLGRIFGRRKPAVDDTIASHYASAMYAVRTLGDDLTAAQARGASKIGR